MATRYSPRIVTDNLILCLDSSSPRSYPGSGSTWKNLAKNSLLGDASLTSYTHTKRRGHFEGGGDGHRGSSYFKFASSSNAVSAGTIDLSGGEMTMDIIFSVTTAEAAACGVYGRIFKYSDTVISLGTYGTNQFRCWANVGGGRSSEYQINSTEPGFYNNWNHACFVRSGTYVNGYWNGELRHSVTRSGALQGSAGVTIGTGDAHLFAGKIAAARLYNRGLSAAEIKQNYLAFKGRLT